MLYIYIKEVINEGKMMGANDWSRRILLFIISIILVTYRILFFRAQREHFVFMMVICVIGSIILIFWYIPL